MVGICLPVLLLLGLKNGQVAELRKKLTESPTGREIKIYTGRDAMPLTLESMSQLRADIPKIQVLIPDIYRSIALSSGLEHMNSVTLYSTAPRDPVLEYYGIVLEEYREEVAPQIAISQTVADTLAVSVGENVTLRITRALRDGREETATAELYISHIIPSENVDKTIEDRQREAVGYVSFELMLDLERYIRGQRVPRFSWMSASPPPDDTYASYLLFTERVSPLSQRDMEMLQGRNYIIEEVKDDRFTQTLGGFLTDAVLTDLTIYRLFLRGRENDNWGQLRDAPRDIERLTDIDDIVVAWNKPMSIQIQEQEYLMVGVTLPDIWIRGYLRQPQFFTEADDTYSVLFLHDEFSEEEVTVTSKEDSVILKRIATEPLTDTEPSTAFVPGKMLAYFYAHQNSRAEFDNLKMSFVQIPQEPHFTEFRAYTHTIDEVRDTAAQLRSRGFIPHSNEMQIDEIHRQSKSLELLVLITALFVFLFGVFTVFSVLRESTDRKRGMIGILRVMGISQRGVFYIVCLRSAIIGLLSFLVIIAFAFVAVALSYILKGNSNGDWSIPLVQVGSENIVVYDYGIPVVFPGIHMVFTPFDICVVSIGAVICCIFGALFPARKASQMDPFDAIMEGKFR